MKKTVVRSVIAALVLLATVLSLAACDDPETTEAETETQTETQKPTSKPSSTTKPSTDDLKGDKVLCLRRVILHDLYSFLHEYFSAIRDLIDKVNCGAGHLDTIAQRLLMNTKTVISLSAERGYQRRMDIEDPLRIILGKTLRQDRHKTCQHDQIDLIIA